MRTTQQLSITLPLELARLVKAKVEAGGYASESEVIREGLRTLLERDAVIERWLQEDVISSVQRYRDDPSRASPLDEAFSKLDAVMKQDSDR